MLILRHTNANAPELTPAPLPARMQGGGVLEVQNNGSMRRAHASRLAVLVLVFAVISAVAGELVQPDCCWRRLRVRWRLDAWASVGAAASCFGL